VKTSFDLTADLRAAMDRTRELEGYGVKQRSAWICEAIVQLPKADPTYANVGLGEARERFSTKLGVILSFDASEVIKKAKSIIRREDPESEGLTGQIIRAAIRARVRAQSGTRTTR